MAKGSGRNNSKATIVIRKDEVVEGAHHGGAWKVAYADFVTAMMAFFLLMWLINATTEAQRRGLADYFSKSNIFSHQTSGSGKPFGGKTPFEDGQMVSDLGAPTVITGYAEPMPDAEDQDTQTAAEPIPATGPGDHTAPGRQDTAGTGKGLPGSEQTYASAAGAGVAKLSRRVAGGASDGAQDTDAKAGPLLPPDALPTDPSPPPDAPPADVSRPGGASRPGGMQAAAGATLSPAELARQERAAFERAAKQIRDVIRSDPALAELAKQLAIDETPEGLRIQIMDEDRQPMFAFGSVDPNERARALLQKVAPVLLRLPEDIAISGYTDAAPFHGGDRSNWDLSTERANATRRLLAEAGLPETRFRSVAGHADRDLLLPADPLAAANRRIAIVVLRSAPPVTPASTATPAPTASGARVQPPR